MLFKIVLAYVCLTARSRVVCSCVSSMENQLKTPPLPRTTRGDNGPNKWGKRILVYKYRFCLCPQVSFQILLSDWQRTGLHIIVLLKRLRCIYNNYTVCYGSIIFYKATTLIKSIKRQRFQHTIFIHKRQRMQ